MFPYIPEMNKAIRNKYTDGSPSQAPAQFPLNVADQIDKATQQKMLMFLNQKYIWPQIQERMPFEKMWKKMLEMARITIPNDDLFSNSQHDSGKANQDAKASNRDKARVSDSVIHDAIECLTDITHFIAFKEGLPAQFAVPEYIKQPMSTPEYKPLEDRVQAGNALLHWNSGNQHVRRNSLLAYRHHFTYGVSFIKSDFQYRVEMINRRDNMGNLIPVPEITEIGTTFEPISLRKLWLNWRMPIYDMDVQPCPFMMEEISRFALLQNVYDPVMNPFGYVNLNDITGNEYIYSTSELQAVRDAYTVTFAAMEETSVGNAGTSQLLEPKHSVEAKWTLYPMMPFDPQTGDFGEYPDKKPVPYKRFIVETFGTNVTTGQQVLLRVQENYFPKRRLPIYSSAHMPDLDSGAYSPSIGQLLYNHFKEITLCMEQFLTNKDWINDPPAWCQISSPAINQDLNAKGAKIKVNGPNDFGWRMPYDATSSTVTMIGMLRENAKTTSKAVNAVLGQAMGGRTSAAEANNAYEASMSSITTDIDLVTGDLHGGYAERVWDYTGLWFDADLLKHITGQFGFIISPEDMWASIGLKTNVGSTYIEKIIKQQNVRYVLESSRMESGINRSALWRELLVEMGFDPSGIVDDGGRDQQVQFATMQACQTYLGEMVIVDPDQDHEIAMKVKTAFIKDRNSNWNVRYPDGARTLIGQIEQHQKMQELLMQQMLVMQQMQVAQSQLKINQENPNPVVSDSAPTKGSGNQLATSAGQISQQGGEAV